jgi:hypothetical protein
MKKFKADRRFAMERREFHYTVCIPERRSGKDRRRSSNKKEILFQFFKQYSSKIENICNTLKRQAHSSVNKQLCALKNKP